MNARRRAREFGGGGLRRRGRSGEAATLSVAALMAIVLACWSSGRDVGEMSHSTELLNDMRVRLPGMQQELLAGLKRQYDADQINDLEYRTRQQKVLENTGRLAELAGRLIQLQADRGWTTQARSLVDALHGGGALALEHKYGEKLVLSALDAACSGGEIAHGHANPALVEGEDVQRIMEEVGLSHAWAARRDDLTRALEFSYVRGLWDRANEIGASREERQRWIEGLATMFADENWQIRLNGGRYVTTREEILKLVQRQIEGMDRKRGNTLSAIPLAGGLDDTDLARVKGALVEHTVYKTVAIDAGRAVVRLNGDGTATLTGPVTYTIRVDQPAGSLGNPPADYKIYRCRFSPLPGGDVGGLQVWTPGKCRLDWSYTTLHDVNAAQPSRNPRGGFDFNRKPNLQEATATGSRDVEWGIVRLQDGAYHLHLPNGLPAYDAPVRWRLKPQFAPPP